MAIKTKKTVAVFAFPRSVPLLIISGRSFVSHVAADTTHFPTPTPALARVNTEIDTLERLESAADLGAAGAAQARDAQKAVVEDLLRQLATYVQGIIIAAGAAGEALARSLALATKQNKGRPPVKTGIERGDTPTTAIYNIASAGRGVRFQRQISTDGTNFSDLSLTNGVSFEVTNLVPGTTYWFRHRVLSPKTGEGQWIALPKYIAA